ncbi:MAG: [protein-PII] uridylyltransferase [Verrucomicrobiota bacterium]
MSVHMEKVLKHAENKLAEAAKGMPTDSLQTYKNFLKIEDHRIHLLHKQGLSGLEVARKRSDMMTIVLRHIFGSAVRNNEKKHKLKEDQVSIALIAVGGFGRGELNPYSDIDIHFLYQKNKPKSVEQKFIADVVDQVLYLLWDVGLKVGHAVRTLDELVSQANTDQQTLTSLLEVRMLAGDNSLFEEFKQRYWRSCIEGKEDKYLKWRLKDQKERHSKFDNTPYRQEPHIKNGCGGLRDYQNLIWMSLVKHKADSTQKLQKLGLLSSSERKSIDAAYDFLLRIRTQVHLIEKRESDVLTLRMQGEVAKFFRYPQRHILRKVEAMMKDYYQHSRNIFLITNLLSERLANKNNKQKAGLWKMLPKSMRGMTQIGAYIIDETGIHLETPRLFKKDPIELLHVFQVAQQQDAVLSAELRKQITDETQYFKRSHLMTARAREIFFDILSHKGKVGRTVREMHRVGLLGKVVPEFAPMTCLVQHEFYHQYTADEHTIVCLEQLDRVLDAEEEPFPQYKNLLVELDHPAILYLALIMHDTGKSMLTQHHAEESAQFASKLAKRMKITGRKLKILMFLVVHHETLSEVAQRRNLDDPDTIRDFARIVQDKERLDMLMLLTLADGKGIGGHNNWSNWKEVLVWHLYHRTLIMLEGEEEFLEKTAVHRANVRANVRERVPAEVGDDQFITHFHLIPDRFLNHANAKTIARQIRCAYHFSKRVQESDQKPESIRPEFYWTSRENQGHTEMILAAKDSEHLFCNIVGAIAVADLNILSSDIITRHDDLAIDTFSVCTNQHAAVTREKDMKLMEEILSAVIENPDYNLDHEVRAAQDRARQKHKRAEGLIFANKVTIDNYTSEEHSLIHIQAPDHLGLLYEISKCFVELQLNIDHARIHTEKGAALDTFYVSMRKNNKKIHTSSLEKELIKRLSIITSEDSVFCKV